MPYAIRNLQGELVALFREPTAGSDEFLSAEHPEVVAFMEDSENADPRLALADSDRAIARVTEDLIHLLIDKNAILFTELPEAVQRKLLTRERLRSSLRDSVDNFLDDEELI